MTAAELLEAARDHPRITLAGTLDATDEIVFAVAPERDDTFGQTRYVAIHAEDILVRKWSEIEDVLLGRRSPRILTFLARIVGYYSQVQNWNRSKLAELRDRHRGDYVIT
jgi:hypothetical protein